MKINVSHIAKLSRLTFSEQEMKKFDKDMSGIIEMVEKLPEMNEISSLIDVENKMELRTDEAQKLFKRDDLLKNAPQVEAGCVVVPKVIE